jgi:RNA polymerase sigma factor for flagellar operon FliA
MAAPIPPPALRAKARDAYASESRHTREDQWIVDHLPLVRHIVQKVIEHLARRIDPDDLISAGTLALVKAARAYDPSRHAEFKTYAYIRVRGAVIDELRGRSFTPPAVHHLLQKIQRAHTDLQSETGKAPDDETLAARAGISVERLYHAYEEARRQHFLSIHGLSDDGPSLSALMPADESPTPAAQVERREQAAALAQALQELPERERHVLILYYERDLTMKEIAEVLGVTESRISQMHAVALFKLTLRLRSGNS